MLLNNSIYGKCMENLRKRINAKLINNSKDKPSKLYANQVLSHKKMFSKNFIAVHQIKFVLILNKPVYVGFSSLELSKLLMYKFYYNYVLNTFNSVKLLFTDTDSLVYEIKAKDVYEQCFTDKKLFDFSEYPRDSNYYDSSNKKVLDKIKDEFNGIKIVEFIGLNSKRYSLISVDDKEVIKAKDVNKKLKHKEHVDVLFNKKVVKHNINRIQSKSHMVGTYDIFKISLPCFDDKKYVLDDDVNTMAYFHKDIKD